MTTRKATSKTARMAMKVATAKSTAAKAAVRAVGKGGVKAGAKAVAKKALPIMAGAEAFGQLRKGDVAGAVRAVVDYSIPGMILGTAWDKLDIPVTKKARAAKAKEQNLNRIWYGDKKYGEPDNPNQRKAARLLKDTQSRRHK